MGKLVKVIVTQKSPSASEAVARNYSSLVDRPEAKGGTDKGPMGGELLLMGLGGCFMSTLLAAVKARDANISDLKVEVNAILEDSPSRFTEIELIVSGKYQDKDLMAKLVTMADRGCIVSNTLRDSVKLTFSIS